MLRTGFLSLMLVFCISQGSDAQVDNAMRKWNINGYVKDLQMVWDAGGGSKWITSNTLHNRLDFSWYPSNSISFKAGMRNRFIYGMLVQEFNPFYSDFIDQDPGFMDLSWMISEDTSYLFHTLFDRMFFTWAHGDLEVSIGRQRINWGLNLVWNPNDIFNSFSYFDFDYEERPGSDAIQIQYYTGMTSSLSLVGALNADDQLTVAAMYRFNKWNYDFQLLGGYMPDDIVLGGGWAGQIAGGGFRGEGSWFIPRNDVDERQGQFVASVDGDYTLNNGLYFHLGALYNSLGKAGKAGGMSFWDTQNISAKMLSPARYSTFGQISYPFNPLINGGLMAIMNPSDGSAYLGPSIEASLGDNLYCMFISQMFCGKKNTEFGEYGKLFFLRFRYSFQI